MEISKAGSPDAYGIDDASRIDDDVVADHNVPVSTGRLDLDGEKLDDSAMRNPAFHALKPTPNINRSELLDST